MKKGVSFFVLAICLSACAVADGRTAQNVIVPAPADIVERTALLLAEATANPPRRSFAMQMLDRMGAKSSEDSEEDPVAEWRAAATAQGQPIIPVRGRALGPAYRSGWLEPGARKSLEQLFMAGETARISLTSPEQAALAFSVVDPQNKPVCQQDGPLPRRCQWVALYTQRYRIEIANSGTKRMRYFLVTN